VADTYSSFTYLNQVVLKYFSSGSLEWKLEVEMQSNQNLLGSRNEWEVDCGEKSNRAVGTWKAVENIRILILQRLEFRIRKIAIHSIH
jgi:hypothetical protein